MDEDVDMKTGRKKKEETNEGEKEEKGGDRDGGQRTY